jgi:hypothetical protein
MSRACHRRGGFALLLVLITVVIVSALALATLAGVGAAQTRTAEQGIERHLALTLQQGEALSVRWLTLHGVGVVLPPAGGPKVLLDERFHTAAGDGALVIDLYDGWAGIPAHLLSGSHRLGTLLPAGMTGLQLPPALPVGPTQPSGLLERASLFAGLDRFPHAVLSGNPRSWDERDLPYAGMEPSPPVGGFRRASLAESVSFHSEGPLNVNTASLDLLTQVYHHFQIGGLDQLTANRQRGSFTPAPQVGAMEGLLLVSQSECWQCLISCTWKGRSRSWWVVIAGNPGAMRIVQRHDATR